MQIYNKDSVNAIFLQPTTICAHHCPGCYVKKFERTNNTKSLHVPDWMGDLAVDILEGKKIKANQLTISLNTPTSEMMINTDCNGDVGAELRVKTYGMNKFIDKLLTANNPNHECELHLTIALDAIEHYYEFGALYGMCDCLSISIDEYKNTKEYILNNLVVYKDKQLNCNLLFTPGVVKSIQQDPGFLPSLAGKFHSIYLIAFKPDLGKPYGQLHVNLLRSLIDVYNNLPSYLKKKVNIDGCVDTCANSSYGCQAGINMFSVWPNGQISGCPYSSQPIREPKEAAMPVTTSDEVINKIKVIKQSQSHLYEYEMCKMRNLWSNRK